MKMKRKMCVLVIVLLIGCLANVISVQGEEVTKPIYIDQEGDSYVIKYEFNGDKWIIASSDGGAISRSIANLRNKNREDGLKEIQQHHTSGGLWGILPQLENNVKDKITIGDGSNAPTFNTNDGPNDKLTLEQLTKAVTVDVTDVAIKPADTANLNPVNPVASTRDNTVEPTGTVLPAEETKIPIKTRQFPKPSQDLQKVDEPNAITRAADTTNSNLVTNPGTQTGNNQDSTGAGSAVGRTLPQTTKYSIEGGSAVELTTEQYEKFKTKYPEKQIEKLTTQSATPTSPAAAQTSDDKGSQYFGTLHDGSYITDTKENLKLYGAKNMDKVTDNKYVVVDVLITTTGENGPSVLNYGGESVTLPTDSEVDFNNMDKATFTVLHTLDEMTWGGLSDLKLYGNNYNLGDLTGFTNQEGNAVVMDMGDSTVYWSSMTVVNDKGETTTYNCNEVGDKCTGPDGVPTGGDYTAETKTKDSITTKIETSVDNKLTTTNFKMMQFENPDAPGKHFMRNVVVIGDSAYYPEITLFGTQWFKFSSADCNGGSCPDGEETSDLPDEVKDAVEEALYGGWWNRMGTRMDLWQQIITTGYSGMSLLYDEPDPIIELDETMSALLGGIDGWTSLICKSKMTDSLDSGMAFSSNPNGAYAHVEGEKIIMGHYNESLPAKTQYYKISVSVDPGGEDTGCDIKFSLYLKGSGGTLYLYEDNGSVSYSSSEKTYELARGDSGISYAGSAMEFFEDERDFGKICIKFHDLYPEFVSAGEGCLVGVNEGDEICNKLNDLGTTESFEDPCHNSFGFIMPHCWG